MLAGAKSEEERNTRYVVLVEVNKLVNPPDCSGSTWSGGRWGITWRSLENWAGTSVIVGGSSGGTAIVICLAS